MKVLLKKSYKRLFRGLFANDINTDCKEGHYYLIFNFQPTQGVSMVHAGQIERLKKDSRELSHYIHKLEKRGKNDIAYKLARRQSFLDAAIEQVESRIRG